MSLISAGSISLDSTFKEPKNRFQGNDSAGLYALSGANTAILHMLVESIL